MFLTRPDRIHDPLYVVTVVFNPIRYKSRWKLYHDFALMCKAAGAKLLTVEVAFGERDFVLQDAPHDYYVPLRTSHELWLKENAINVGFSRLPAEWKYGAWIDADIIFMRGDWADETLHQLQHYPIIQMFSQSQDLTPQYEVLRTFRGYAWCVKNDIPRKGMDIYSYATGEYYHPGYAWAIRREAFNQLGGLLDWAILGGGDLFMANALFNKDQMLPQSLGSAGLRWLNYWKERAHKHIKGNVGYMDGLVNHFWHGKKADRKYQDRGSILTSAKFDPERDLIKDFQGLYQLNTENRELRDGIQQYVRARNEDSIDV